MREELLRYYERELGFIRQMAAGFAAKYPKIASRLQLESDKCEDPHVERLIEAFALLAARVHQKVDDEFPEITQALLGLLYPHFLYPLPSMSVVQFMADPELGDPSGGYRIDKGTLLYSMPGRGIPCQFRTCYPVTLWPLEVISAAFLPSSGFPRDVMAGDAAAMVRLELKCTGEAELSSLRMDRLRFFLNGESRIVHTLYELLFNNCLRVVLRDRTHGSRPVQTVLPPGSMHQVGFARDEGILPYPSRSFQGYRLLQEYFSFPQKFLFVDLCGLNRASNPFMTHNFEILILLSECERKDRLPQLEQSVNSETFRLGCTPIVNLFERHAEPVRLSHTQTEYLVIPDLHNRSATEVYSIDRVTSAALYGQEPHEYEPFYSFRHVTRGNGGKHFWYSTRRPATAGEESGTEVYLSLVDLDFNPGLPPEESLLVHVTCTNRDLPSRLPFSGEYGEFQRESSTLLRIRCLLKPTETVRPSLRRGLQWRLISHLGLNYLSIVEEGGEPLREILKLYDFSESPFVQQQIAGITRVSSAPQFARVVSENGVVFCSGLNVSIEFDEDKYVGGGIYLLASVLEGFLGLYSSINSFSQLTATSKQRKGVMRQWAPRSGDQILL